MLSKKSETFIDNLRMYLMTSGKKDTEIKELIEELTDHLVEAEKMGRDIEDIIDGTPEQYMALLKKEMKTDYKHIIKLLPIFFLGLTAYFLMGPAISGEFELNFIQVVGFPINATFALIVYIFFLQQAGKKQYSNKKFMVGAMIAYFVVTIPLILLLVGGKLFADPFFKGNPTTDTIVIIICSIILIGVAIWSKSWTPIWIPMILYIPDVLSRFTSLSVETILYISMGTFILIFIGIFINLIVIEKKRKIV